MTFVPGAIVRLTADAPRNYIAARGLVGRVTDVLQDPRITVADVAFDRGSGYESDALTVKDIPVRYLTGAASEPKQKRKGVLNLHMPQDNRTEREKQDEAVKWLRHPERGYVVLLVGQYMSRIQCTAEGCGHWFWPDGFGNSVGYPDLSVFHPTHWAPSGERRPVLLLEFKRNEKADRKPKQIEIADQGASAFVWSLAMVAQEIYRFERDVLRIKPHPALEPLLRFEDFTEESR